jgi:hypothetical protein
MSPEERSERLLRGFFEGGESGALLHRDPQSGVIATGVEAISEAIRAAVEEECAALRSEVASLGCQVTGTDGLPFQCWQHYPDEPRRQCLPCRVREARHTRNASTSG